MVLAARALAKDAHSVSLDVAGETRQRRALPQLPRRPICRQPLRVTNNGDDAVQAVVSVTGAPMTPEPAAEKGFKIERLYYTLDGEPADADAR